jgi:hypothetical protein
MTTVTLEDIWALFKETDRILKENAQAAEKRFQEIRDEDERRSKEAEKRFQEIRNEEQKRSKEAEKRFQEIRDEEQKRSKEFDRKLNKLEHLFTSQWGKLIESLVEGALVKIFNERGIPVQQTAQRVKGIYQGNQWEIDIVVKNGDAVIIVEVKTTLSPDDVKDFLKKLPHIKTWLKEYTNNTMYGAVAYLNADAGAEQLAKSRGLFVIRATGESARIENSLNFSPRIY